MDQLVQSSTLKSQVSAVIPAPTALQKTGLLCSPPFPEPCERLHERATRHASSTSCCAVTPPRFIASLRTIKIACSKRSVSGESTTITRRDVPLTTLHHSFARFARYEYARAARRLYGMQNFLCAFFLHLRNLICFTLRQVQCQHALIISLRRALNTFGKNC